AGLNQIFRHGPDSPARVAPSTTWFEVANSLRGDTPPGLVVNVDGELIGLALTADPIQHTSWAIRADELHHLLLTSASAVPTPLPIPAPGAPSPPSNSHTLPPTFELPSGALLHAKLFRFALDNLNGLFPKLPDPKDVDAKTHL